MVNTYEREVKFSTKWSKDSFRFKKGDKAIIVDEDKCQELDCKFCNRKDHSFIANQTVTIKDVLKDYSTLEPTYTIEEVDSNIYFWEDSFFK